MNDEGQWLCTCGEWHAKECTHGGRQVMATGSEGWDL